MLQFANINTAKMSDVKGANQEVDFVDSKIDNSSSPSINIDPEEEAKLVRKIDLYILPTMWLMYLLSYMDRTK